MFESSFGYAADATLDASSFDSLARATLVDVASQSGTLGTLDVLVGFRKCFEDTKSKDDDLKLDSA